MDDVILWECSVCGYKWNGDCLDDDCPSCESEDIKPTRS